MEHFMSWTASISWHFKECIYIYLSSSWNSLDPIQSVISQCINGVCCLIVVLVEVLICACLTIEEYRNKEWYCIIWTSDRYYMTIGDTRICARKEMPKCLFTIHIQCGVLKFSFIIIHLSIQNCSVDKYTSFTETLNISLKHQ